MIKKKRITELIEFLKPCNILSIKNIFSITRRCFDYHLFLRCSNECGKEQGNYSQIGLKDTRIPIFSSSFAETGLSICEE